MSVGSRLNLRACITRKSGPVSATWQNLSTDDDDSTHAAPRTSLRHTRASKPVWLRSSSTASHGVSSSSSRSIVQAVDEGQRGLSARPSALPRRESFAVYPLSTPLQL